MILEQLLVLMLLCLEVLFVIIQLVLEEADQVFGISVELILGGALRLSFVPAGISSVAKCDRHISAESSLVSKFQLLVLLAKPLDHLLAELRPFSELFFDVFVDCDVALEAVEFFFHLLVFHDEVFGLSALVVELSCQLHVLQDRELRSCL